jgi:hypothetical protein
MQAASIVINGFATKVGDRLRKRAAVVAVVA